MLFFTLFLLFLTILFLILSIAILVVLFYTRVPFVRTPQQVIDTILKEIDIEPNDTIYDLGCGDGRFMIETEKRTGTHLTGFEISPWAYLLGRLNLLLTRSKSKILYKNFYKENLAPADVIFCFLIDSVMPKVGKQLEAQLKPGALIISFAFKIPQWQPSKIINPFPNKEKSSKIYIYYK